MKTKKPRIFTKPVLYTVHEGRKMKRTLARDTKRMVEIVKLTKALKSEYAGLIFRTTLIEDVLGKGADAIVDKYKKVGGK